MTDFVEELKFHFSKLNSLLWVDNCRLHGVGYISTKIDTLTLLRDCVVKNIPVPKMSSLYLLGTTAFGGIKHKYITAPFYIFTESEISRFVSEPKKIILNSTDPNFKFYVKLYTMDNLCSVDALAKSWKYLDHYCNQKEADTNFKDIFERFNLIDPHIFRIFLEASLINKYLPDPKKQAPMIKSSSFPSINNKLN
jgi:hypothetical protein